MLRKEEENRRDGSLGSCAGSQERTSAPKASFIWMSQIAKSPLVSLETAGADVPSSPRKAHKSPQKNWPQGVCSHKCREDKTITLIVAQSPRIDLVVL
jgi:hypothetical protein